MANLIVLELSVEYPVSDDLAATIAQKSKEALRNAIGDHPVEIVRAELKRDVKVGSDG